MTSIWTEQELREEIDLYKRAIKACASGSSYTIGSRSLTRQNLKELREHLDYLAGELAALEGRRGPVLVQGRIYRGSAGWRKP
jgi:bacterioferritin (cytochrome b1)